MSEPGRAGGRRTAAAGRGDEKNGLARALEALDEDPRAAAREYLLLRRRLCEYFDRRGAWEAEDLADEVLDRLALRLGEGEVIVNLPAFAHGVARLVELEWRRRLLRRDLAEREAARELSRGSTPSALEPDGRSRALERCLADLPTDTRRLIFDYYRGAGSDHLVERRRLAESLGLTYGALKTRAHRVRRQLEACLKRRFAGRLAGPEAR